MFKRSSGVLAHVTSLPSPHGVGTMGKAAYDFVDFLADAHQTYWQVLPLGHTGFGDSPYQCFSAAAGNPYLIDLDLLVEDGLLTEAEVKQGDFARPRRTRRTSSSWRTPAGRCSASAYSRVDDEMRAEIAAFTEENAEWLPDYALFMALKEEKYHHMPVYMWPEKAVRDRKPAALAKVTEELRDEIDFRIFLQYIFFKQWTALREYANEKGIQIIGDIPIYVSADSVGRVDPSQAVQAQGRPQPQAGRGRAARLLFRHRPAVGQPGLRLGGAPRRGLCLVDLAHEEQHGAVRRDPSGPFPRLCGLLGGQGHRGDGDQRPLAQGTGHGAVPGHRESARPGQADRGGPGRADRRGASSCSRRAASRA